MWCPTSLNKPSGLTNVHTIIHNLWKINTLQYVLIQNLVVKRPHLSGEHSLCCQEESSTRPPDRQLRRLKEKKTINKSRVSARINPCGLQFPRTSHYCPLYQSCRETQTFTSIHKKELSHWKLRYNTVTCQILAWVFGLVKLRTLLAQPQICRLSNKASEWKTVEFFSCDACSTFAATSENI